MSIDEQGEQSVDPGGSTGTRPRFDWVGADRDKRELAGGDDGGASATDVPEYGMTSEQLYEYQRKFTEYAARRLLGVGKKQYDLGRVQKFEDMSVMELAVGLSEELADVVNYAVMLDIRMKRILYG